MAEREKVLKVLECCIEGLCDCCPYVSIGGPCGCKDEPMADLLSVLKEQEPSVLTLEEVKLSRGILVWLERSFGAGHETVVAPIEITGVGTGGISFYFGNEDFRAYGHPVYGWRCWTAKPTDEHRKAVKWDG